MKKILIFGFVIVLIAVGWMVKSYTGKDYALYKEAKELEAKGDIYAAHDKVAEALEINPKNRKVISYKSQLYFLVKNDSALKSAYESKADAEKAMDSGDYALASKKLDDALAAVDNVSSLYSGYSEAEKLQAEIIKDVEKLVREAPEKYYLKGYELYKRGEYERAYNMLEYIISPSPKVVKLMDEIAYKIGTDKSIAVLENKDNNSYLANDAVIWLSKVSQSSPKYKDAKALISKIKNYLAAQK